MSSLLPPKTRICRKCSIEKDLVLFCVAPLCKFGYSHTCRECKNKQSELWAEEHKERRSEQAKLRRQSWKVYSGDWEVYFKFLIKSKKDDGLVVSDLLDLLEAQGGKCALSGETLTAEIAQGKVLTNASMDRIFPGGLYIKSNIRLVCTIVNSMRLNMDDSELLSWCEKIIKHQGEVSSPT